MELHRLLQGHLLLQIYGNYLLDELYVLNSHMNMTWLQFSPLT